MKILSLTTSYPRSPEDDSSIFLHRLNRAFAALGHEVTVLAPTQAAKPSQEQRENLQIQWFRFLPFINSKLVYGAGLLPNLKRFPLRAFELPCLVLRLVWLILSRPTRPHIVHANWILTGIAAWIARCCGGPTYVVTLRGSDVMILRATVARWVAAPALRGAAAITVVSEELLKEFRRRLPHTAPDIRCIYNGVEPRLAHSPSVAEYKLPARYLIAVGSVIPRKRVLAAIEILNSPALAGYSLVICGKTEDAPYLDLLNQYLAGNNLTARVRFIGAVPPLHIPALLDGASAFIAMSEFEGRPNAVLEALAMGKVILCSDIPAHREVLQDGANGLLCDPAHPDAAAEKLAGALRDHATRERISAAAINSVAGQTWQAAAERYLSVFERVKGPA